MQLALVTCDSSSALDKEGFIWIMSGGSCAPNVEQCDGPGEQPLLPEPSHASKLSSGGYAAISSNVADFGDPEQCGEFWDSLAN
mmetsp:Transcript_8395/g.15740  ORF Transcript_8395/g.15740 Transcript_8395/m.15740 type:complete len:84 (+) Transcript_8395:224-475(+)